MYVLEKMASGWVQRKKLTANDANAGDSFGYSVAIDGNTVVEGARYGDDFAANLGTAYVFTGSGSNWTFQQDIYASDGATTTTSVIR